MATPGPFESIPTELLILILKQTIPTAQPRRLDLKDYYCHLAAYQHVCRDWKAAVEGTPPLWIYIYNAMSTDLRRLALRLSGNHELDIYGWFLPEMSFYREHPEDDWEADEVKDAEFIKDILPHSARFRYMQLGISKLDRDYYELLICRWDAMEELDLISAGNADEDDFPDTLAGGIFPRLRSVAFSGFLPYPRHPMWAAVEHFTTHTELVFAEADDSTDGVLLEEEFFGMLAWMPKLRSFRLDCGNCYKTNDPYVEEVLGEVPVPNLERLFLRGADARGATRLLEHAKSPMESVLVDCRYPGLPTSLALAKSFGRVAPFGRWLTGGGNLDLIFDDVGLCLGDGDSSRLVLRAPSGSEARAISFTAELEEIVRRALESMPKEKLNTVISLTISPQTESKDTYRRILNVADSMCPKLAHIITTGEGDELALVEILKSETEFGHCLLSGVRTLEVQGGAGIHKRAALVTPMGQGRIIRWES